MQVRMRENCRSMRVQSHKRKYKELRMPSNWIRKKNWEKYFTENPCKIGNNATLTHEGANAILIHEGFIIEDPEDDEMIIDDTFEGDNLNNSIIS